jgi:predicted small secreted protein
LNSLALVSRAAQSPKTMSAAGKDVASAQKSIQAAKAAPAKKGSAKSKAAPPSNNVPDL